MQKEDSTTGNIRQRLDELRTELGKGEGVLAQLDGEAAEIRQQILRISGAIQVLEELLDESRERAKK